MQRIPTPKQPADPYKIRLLLAEAASAGNENEAARVLAIRALRNLAKEGEKNRIVMVDSGVVPTLIGAIFSSLPEADVVSLNSPENCPESGHEPSSDTRAAVSTGRVCGAVAEEALAALVLLPLNDTERMNMVQPQKLAFISSVLRRGSPDARVNAGALIEMLSDSKELHELRVVLAGTEGVMGGLVRLLQEGLCPRAIKVGIKALFSLCFRRQGKERAVAAGAPSSLIERLVDVDKADAERALGTIELLCTTEAGCRAVANHALSVAVLVKVILKVSDRATEYAAGSLLAICSYSEKVRKDAVQAGIIKELLLLIQSDCTDRAKTKAMNLLKLLRSAWINNGQCMPEYGRTDVVPF